MGGPKQLLCLQLAIKEGSTLRVRADATKIERDVFVYRSYIAVGNYAVVLDEIKETRTTPPDLIAVKLLATYLYNPSARETTVLAVHQLLEDAGTMLTHINLSFFVSWVVVVPGSLFERCPVLPYFPTWQLCALVTLLRVV